MADEPAAKRVCATTSLAKATREELLTLTVLLAFKAGKQFEPAALECLVPADVLAALKTVDEADKAYSPYRSPFGSHEGKSAALCTLRGAQRTVTDMADRLLQNLEP
jgi:hypothetical protein